MLGVVFLCFLKTIKTELFYQSLTVKNSTPASKSDTMHHKARLTYTPNERLLGCKVNRPQG